MDDAYFKRLSIISILLVLTVLSFFILKPILLSIFGGFLLAFIFFPIYSLLLKKIKSPGLCAGIICLILILIILIPILLFSQAIIKETIFLYQSSQKLDLVTPLKKIFPSIFSNEEFSYSISASIQGLMLKVTQSLRSYVSNLVYEFPTILLNLFIIFFIFFYALKDKEKILSYLEEFLPFTKDIKKKLFQSTKDITSSVLYGQLVLGTIQGTILGIGVFVLNVPNAFLLTLIGVLAGIFPLIGPSLVGIPVAMYFILNDNYVSAMLILLFTALSSSSEPILRPFLVSKKARLHPALVLAGMVGGFLFLGITGLILGPLILAYLLIIIEIYRNKELPGLLLKCDS